MISEEDINYRILQKFRFLVEAYVARPCPNPYQSEPYNFEIKQKKECLILADEFEASLKK